MVTIEIGDITKKVKKMPNGHKTESTMHEKCRGWVNIDIPTDLNKSRAHPFLSLYREYAYFGLHQWIKCNFELSPGD